MRSARGASAAGTPTPTTLALALLGAFGGAVAAASALLVTPARAQTASPAAPAASTPESASRQPRPLRPSLDLAPPPRGDAAQQLPIVLRADTLGGRPDRDAVAEGNVEFRRGGLLLRADRLHYDVPEDLVRATGHVRIRRDGVVYSGPELQLRVQRFEGFFREPEFEFLRLASGGRADRVDFLDSARAVAHNAQYTSCPRDGSGDPPWVLKAERVRTDLEANEGIAEGGVLRFLGVPILAAPILSFPLTDDRKSGWLPPSFNLDSRSGLDLSVPYYWNIAPNRDATFTPRLMTRRGLALGAEFRYLEPGHGGRLELELLPHDRIENRARHAWSSQHEGSLGSERQPWLRYEARIERVSDDRWWRDFPNASRVLTPRLLPTQLDLASPLAGSGLAGEVYARALQWQVLQHGDAVLQPFQRSPQLGVQLRSDPAAAPMPGGVHLSLQSEFNRFTLPGSRLAGDTRSEGDRWHLLASLGRSWRAPGWWITPQLSLNAASYRTDQPMSDGRRSASRVIPTFSIDSGMLLEREFTAFSRAIRQTLEPRVHYVNTPYRNQTALPNFDATERDFNASNLFADNRFVGIDRVSDSHQVAAGVTTRLIDATTGIEALRLGVVQRYLLRDQRVTGDGQPLTQRFSDLLVVGSTSVVPSWTFDTAVQYSTQQQRTRRSVLAARFSPGDFQTLSVAYRFTRDASEQVELGWQWPLRLSSPSPAGLAAAGAAGSSSGSAVTSRSACTGNWYSVGRVNYSARERRITDSVLGLEYDAGCWIGRAVFERLSTGRSEATTRLVLQLELVGLSRLGGNPLKVLKDNIPGYRLLRDEVRSTSDTTVYD
jgi:LPS-assembly protein